MDLDVEDGKNPAENSVVTTSVLRAQDLIKSTASNAAAKIWFGDP